MNDDAENNYADLTPSGITTLSDALEWLMERSIVTDYADEYGEPGYSLDNPDGCFVVGNWWCHGTRDTEGCQAESRYNDGSVLHDVMDHYPRIGAMFEAEGVETAFYDEWFISHNSSPSKAYRTSADSYSWQSSIMWSEEACDYLTPDDDVADWVAEVVNQTNKCIPGWVSDEALSELGFAERECGYESGWYGVEDNPAAIAESLAETDPDADVLFKLSSVEQFRVTFCVYVRDADHELNTHKMEDE